MTIDQVLDALKALDVRIEVQHQAMTELHAGLAELVTERHNLQRAALMLLKSLPGNTSVRTAASGW